MENNSDKLDTKFNATADGPPEGGSDADAASRKNRTRGRVVEYVDADPDTRKLMDAIMLPIDKKPDSFEAIIEYGHPPLAKLGTVADGMIKIQGKFNTQVNVMAGALEGLENGLKGMNLEKFGESAKKLFQGMAVGGVKGVRGLGKMLKSLKDSMTGAKAKQTEDEKVVKDMQDALPEMLRKMVGLTNNIRDTEEGIKQVMAEAEKLGYARVEATKEIGLYLGAAKEVLRRYNEEYIPEANKTFDETADPEDEMYLKDVMKRKEDFLDRITVLEGSRAASVIAAQQLRQMMETMEDQRKKIQDILHNSQNEWKAMLASAGIAGSSLKAAQSIKKADEFGDEMHDQTMQMIEEAHTLTQNSKARGTIDPQKLIEASDRLQKMIDSENTARQDRLRTLEETAGKLRIATDNLLEAADSSNKARMLEAVKQAEDGSAQAKKELEAKKSNDNKTANDDKTAAPVAPTPAAVDPTTPAAPPAEEASRRPPRPPRAGT